MPRNIEGGDEVLLRLDVTRADNETFTVRFRSKRHSRHAQAR